ncbi:mechanosensitive ion channel domain-containing protein [Cyanobium sp. NS01]|uniref:mechanosensitive ion channel domain-containing protein n=1 Tax=Cyanobium sp. NS01 TaxID=261284 RepID=UPI001648239C|nr:mechanosensitive ion channel domain-containing protein [Cyanobium sp. NS01]QNI71920.1 hypothetical protein CyaNS01_02826 [Cyanobium sp. NS01]
METATHWLAVPFLPLGERSYSLLDVVILVALLVRAVWLVLQLLRSRVLRYTGMSAGGQEAVAFVARYGLLLVGTLVLLQLWGLDLTSLTLFASVLGVGVGLGLQGITKNFLSGLIIIFERPIQVGDFVEIGDLQGSVDSLGLRSTKVTTLPAGHLGGLQAAVGLAAELKQHRLAVLSVGRPRPQLRAVGASLAGRNRRHRSSAQAPLLQLLQSCRGVVSQPVVQQSRSLSCC